ncbi:MAG: phosphoribosylaminoimidazolesuccinocarboxamide synthase [Syntrophomonas sp.]|jgi:phosphoribosylaminoimidazole-succinocarboxamide synthase|nr:phosphoribosylaminoimidazolesuccinocarboxamide synthase [Syntrophomonas sp.]
MQHVYEGKTKSVFALENGNYLLKMKDDVTGENGQIDPGANSLMGQLEGMGNASLRMSRYYFELLQKNNIPSHYIDANLDDNTMIVKPAKAFGDGLEIICRYKVYGSFWRRYARYAQKGQDLDELVEVTLKDDDRGDPPIGEEALVQLGLMTHAEYKLVRNMTQQIARIVKNDLAAKGMELYDIKFEFGRVGDEVMIIDDISGGNMRVFKDGKQVDPLELAVLVTQ